MKIIAVLVMQGIPPRDFPQYEVAELFTLSTRLKYTYGVEREALEKRHTELDKKIRNWPRTEHNDPLIASSHQLSTLLKQTTNYEVIVAYNEYCSPSVDEALDLAVRSGADKIVVIPMSMVSVGGQLEVDIAKAIEHAQSWRIGIPITCAWPFDISEVIQLIKKHINRFA
ncbi:MAG: CbiX/SirB N-terminal domain-containing protein [Dehalococcoidia bacterium]|nr:MAG: CbiX/SirB N-terminal domain-containing protein [Dehalococcoidia bacterium]